VKRCTKCGEEKPLSGFYSNRSKSSGWESQCRSCQIAGKAKRYREDDDFRLRRLIYWRARNGRSYSLTTDEYKEMVIRQGGRCAICGSSDTALCIDHCHSEGSVRGLLCNSCNLGLGFFKDDPSRLGKAIRYIEMSQSENGASLGSTPEHSTLLGD
jgi:hypothetical protein